MKKPQITPRESNAHWRTGGWIGRLHAVLAGTLAIALVAAIAAGTAPRAAAAQSTPSACPPGGTGSPAATGPVSALGSALGQATPGATPTACASPAAAVTVPTSPQRTATAGATATPRPGASEIAPTLPPPDIPGSNQQGYSFKLKAQLKVGFDNVPNQAPVYQLIHSPLSAQDAQSLADRLKIGGKIEERGQGSFAASGAGGQLFVSPDVTQFVSPVKAQTGTFPADNDALAIAREWLRESGLVPPDIGSGKIVSKNDKTGRLVVLFGPVEPDNVLSGYPSVTVSLDAKGQILEATSRWAIIQRGDLYQLRAPAQVWELVKSGQAYIEVNVPASDYPGGSEIDGTVAYTDISVAYTTAGPPGGQQYLEPIFVFSGQLKPDGSKQSFPLKAYVAALASSNSPVG